MVAQMVKDRPAMQQKQVQSLGQEDPLEKGMATHSSILAWKIPWMGYSQWGHKELDMTKHARRASLIAQLVKNPPAIQETLV